MEPLMRIEVIRAWPRRHQSVVVQLPAPARVADALQASGLLDGAEECAYAVFGAIVTLDAPLADGDRLELLRPLQMDPKEARRRRAGKPGA
ncbi:RnfH family protein [Pseudoxanthomonas wuyuanensis]|nr:RnfH family protein [Pseudoxanthomonas wuyuanensis]KAF1722809.1 RnfH family protein [Pseudoxanthomonas wuyuanensis]